MHASSMDNMQRCYNRYIRGNSKFGVNVKVADIGGQNVNGSYRDIFSLPQFDYLAIDLEDGDGIDVVLQDPYVLPFENESVELIISGQAFEHVEFFWLLFEEMVRVLSPNGFIFLIAPSGGKIHRYPVDCYRFYPDSFFALSKYTGIEPVEIYMDDKGPWNDLVGVFSKATAQTDFEPTAWPQNEYEKVCQFPVPAQRHPNPDYEKRAGTIPYLKLLRALHAILDPNSYVEIGVHLGKSLSLASSSAIGIDPEPLVPDELQSSDRITIFKGTSDEFFSTHKKCEFDLAFIDGLHLFEYALRDFMNLEMRGKTSSVIVIDDIYPNSQAQASRTTRETVAWTGDVWRLALCLELYRPELTLTYVDAHPTGCLVVTGLAPSNRLLWDQYNPIVRKTKLLELTGALSKKFLDRTDALKSIREVLKSMAL